MKRTSGWLGAAVLAIGMAAGGAGAQADAARRPVDLAICLDTSGSMNGLIDAARRRLWDITNELARAKPTPRLRVALLVYGSPRYPAAAGWVQVESDFTDDLDGICRKLFALTTDGGDEYVGRVIQTALDRLAWSASNDALQMIYVAGNESADQDREVSFRDACRRAIAKGIVVNAIHCDAPGSPDAPGWREIAMLADGRFASIDQNHGTVEIATPFDRELVGLNADLNATYLGYGAQGRAGAANQAAQDVNAASLSLSSAAARTVSKGGALYSNGAWDLVDACRERKVDLAALKEEELPDEMRKLPPSERQAHVDAMARKRAEIQMQIGDLNAKRQVYIAEEMKKQGQAEDKAFDAAVRSALREQAAKKGFTFPN